MRSIVVSAALLLLSSCSSPPHPPAADESRRHPLNAAAEVGWQSCKSELLGVRIALSETIRDVDRLRTSLSATRAVGPTARPSADGARVVTYTLLFPFGSTAVELKSPRVDALFAQAKAAPLIVLSGRTDGALETPAESRVARERAEFVRDALLRNGVPAARIRMTWQPVGDHAADNSSPAGRSLNRRVEIDLYPAAPRAAQLGPTAES